MACTKYKHTFSEGKIGNITIPNRLVMAPMGVGHYGEFLEERLVEFYGARARGGIGLVFLENNYVSSFEDDPYPRFMPVPRFDDDRKISRAHAIASRIKEYGGVAGMQLGAGQGRNAELAMADHPPMSVSAIPTYDNPNVICKEMTKEDIAAKVASFGRAAARALFCGFEVIEVHAHSGYLVEQFLSKNINQRTDEYGGSAENRFRFAKEILEAIRKEVGNKAAVTIRLSVDHLNENGIKLEEGLEYCKLAEQAGYDAVNIDAGSREAVFWNVPAPYLGKTPLRKFAREAKKVVNIPVIAVGSYLAPEYVEETLEAGDADFVALGRALLADPDWAKKAKLGKEEDIRCCIQCNLMCSSYTFVSKTATCAINPTCGLENEVKLEKAEEPKRVTVIGGGPAGMVTAIVASRRGHTVTLLEKADQLGGNMNIVGKEKCKDGVRRYNKYLQTQIAKRNIPVELSQEVTVEKVRETNPDVVVAATGSSLFIPNIPGFKNNEKVITIADIDEKVTLTGKEKVVVVGGGVIGCETALELAQNGHDVTVVEMMEEFATSLSIINRKGLLALLNGMENVTMLPKTKCRNIEGNILTCEDAEGNELKLDFDLCVAAVGMKSENEFGKVLAEEYPETYIIGDAVSQDMIAGAVHQGFFTGLRI